MSRWHELMDPAGARERREAAERLGVDPDDPAVTRDLERLEQPVRASAPEWGMRAGRPRPTGKANRLAVFALFCAFVVPVLGVVFGLVALDEIDESEDAERGRAMARWAIGIGAVLLGLAIAWAVWFIVRFS